MGSLKRDRHRIIVAMLMTLACETALGESLTLDLAARGDAGASTSVINTALSYTHPPLRVDQWDEDFSAPTQTRPISVGNGQHGSFNSTTYLNFHDGAYGNDQVIVVDTDKHPELHFTAFTLDTGWTLRPKGSRPLVIRSLTSIHVAGTIDCSGNAGSSASVSSSTAAGGQGRCGGRNGGSGSSVSVLASNGAATSVFPNAGGGAGTASGDGGGGGAGMGQAPGPGIGLDKDDINPGGAAGTAGNDDAFSHEGGGGGGGGGAVYAVPGDEANHSSGAGGGAGGGDIYLYAVGNVVIDGSVLANGGNGGSVLSGRGGAGGGGAGGSVLIFAGSDLLLNGTVTAASGAGGTGAGGNGGAGGMGRTWTTDSDGAPSGAGTLDPFGLLPSWGLIDYQIGSFYTVTETVDLGNSRSLLDSASTSGAAVLPSTLSLEIATSDSATGLTTASWESAALLLGREIKRYVRFRVAIDNQATVNPANASAVTLTYSPQSVDQFEFGSCLSVGGGAAASADSTRDYSFKRILIVLLMLLMPIALATGLRRRQGEAAHHSSPVEIPY